MPDQHLVTEYRVRDTGAVQRRGCTTRTDHDHGENYDGHEALFPDESAFCWGTCPHDGTPVYDSGCRFLLCSNALGKHRLFWPGGTL